MEFYKLWFEGTAVVLLFMSMVWLWSVRLKNASIVDPFWGMGFVVVTIWYAFRLPVETFSQGLLIALVIIWGLRLFGYLFARNYGKEEDYRYQQFRKKYGENIYWWFSFFQVFMLQGVLLSFISVTILGGLMPGDALLSQPYFTVAALVLWLIGFFFESVGDYQMAKFKAHPGSRGKVMDKGLWRYTRHPNYFGDTVVWWAYALFAIGNGHYWAVGGAVLMTWLIVRVSGVSMLERNLKTKRKGYDTYIKRTSAFFPWFPSDK